ncbi:MAG: NAD(P)-dependent oxidoreductase [Betaproteobacteria bacterium]|nr:NAD(P)-dependent oxidoreductase [Betaproteobacteria bacterium]
MKAAIGFVGAGWMGTGMAMRLLAAGHPVSVHAHRHRSGVDRLCARGAAEASNLAALARGAEVIVLSLSDAEAVRAVLDGVGPGLRAGCLVIDTTTSDPRVTRALAESLSARGVRLVDAPVTGGPAQAEAGVLGSLVGCAASDFDAVQRIASCYSTVVQRMGEVGSGHAAKLLNNFVTQGTVVLLAEAYARARDNGIDWQALYAVMGAGAARSGTLEKVVGPALGGDYDGSKFTIRNAAKDLGYYCALAAGSDRGPSTLGEVIRQRFADAQASGAGNRFVSRLLDPNFPG